MLHIGSASAFQADGASSILVIRSTANRDGLQTGDTYTVSGFGLVAQWLERPPDTRDVEGSNPSQSTQFPFVQRQDISFWN